MAARARPGAMLPYSVKIWMIVSSRQCAPQYIMHCDPASASITAQEISGDVGWTVGEGNGCNVAGCVAQQTTADTTRSSGMGCGTGE